MGAFTPRVYKNNVYPKPIVDIVSRKLVERHVAVEGSKSGETVLKREVVEVQRINRKEYVKSFVNDCGIEALMRKFQQVNDPSIFFQVEPNPAPGELDEKGRQPIVDYTGLQENPYDALEKFKVAEKQMALLPEELQALIKANDVEGITNYLNNYYAQKNNPTDGGDK